MHSAPSIYPHTNALLARQWRRVPEKTRIHHHVTNGYGAGDLMAYSHFHSSLPVAEGDVTPSVNGLYLR